MGFLNRKIHAPEPLKTDDDARIIHREIEITVQREWIAATAVQPTSASGQRTDAKLDSSATLE